MPSPPRPSLTSHSSKRPRRKTAGTGSTLHATPRDLLESFLVLAGVLGLLLLLYVAVPTWASSTRRVLHPFSFVPSVGSVKIIKVVPGDADLLIGSSLQISAEIDNPKHKAPSRHIYVREPGKPEAALAMLPDDTNGKFLAALAGSRALGVPAARSAIRRPRSTR